MKKRHTDRQETFAPMRDKTLKNVLRHQFVTEFGYENKVIFAEAMIERILETIASFTQPAARLKPGQMLWMAVPDDGRKHTKKRMRDTPQVPIVLDLVTDEELAALEAGEEYQSVRRARQARLLKQARAQGGVLAQSDLAAITLRHRKQVGQDIAVVQHANGHILPYRGSVQDIGATTTHKVEVIRLFEAGFLEPEICQRLAIPHDLTAVENYVQTYKNMLKLLERGFTPPEVAGILSISRRLVEDYLPIIAEHQPAALADQSWPNSKADGQHKNR
ncbi:MAG TPA: DUF1670 domain-containing protein [Candidatus Sulfomarinibacteraceae bacterium]|nr:DUF1670 domain-containing protein [Candidatus Sulfomarinibacteraceae bacterium]